MITKKTSNIQILGLSNDLSLSIKVAVIAISTLLIFFQDIFVVGSEAFASDYYNYVVIIPLLSFYLIYRKRRMLSAVIHLSDDRGKEYVNYVLGASGLGASLIAYLYGAYTSFPLDYHLIALQIFLLSEVVLLFNKRVLKIVAFPIILISTALPSVVGTGIGFWQDMSLSGTYASYAVLHWIGLRATLS